MELHPMDDERLGSRTVERRRGDQRVGRKGSHACIRAPLGSWALMVRGHEPAYLFGAICPDRAVGAAMITPGANSEAMTLHLTQISPQVASDAHALLLCDGAGWHPRGKEPRVPDNIALLSLP